MNEELTPQKERFLQEVEHLLLRKELDARLLEDGLIHVRWNEKPLCSVDRDGIVRFRPADITGPEVDKQLRTVIQTADHVKEYTLPLLRPMIGTISVMAANYGLLLYNEIALITSGGPDNATYSLSYYIYKTSLGSTKLNFARGNTAGVIQFILGIVIVCLINRAFRSDTSD